MSRQIDNPGEVILFPNLGQLFGYYYIFTSYKWQVGEINS